MPNRIIKDSVTTSPTLDALSPEAERLFHRLVTKADDYGRFEADPRLLLALCFPLRIGKWTPARVERWYAQLEAVGLVRSYIVESRPYGWFLTWGKHQRVRNQQSKYPPPPDPAAQFATIGFQRAISVELERLVRERDRICLACGSEESLVIDHVVAVVEGGQPTEENLQLLCAPCNGSKGRRALNFRVPDEATRLFVAARREARQTAAAGRDRPPAAASSGPSRNPIQSESESNLSSGRRARRLPEDFELSEATIRWAKGKGLDDAGIDRELDAFCTHYWANGKPMLDWQMAFMSWIRKSLEWAGRKR